MPLKVAAYHGSGRGKVDFGEYDVIVTSYGLLFSLPTNLDISAASLNITRRYFEQRIQGQGSRDNN